MQGVINEWNTGEQHKKQKNRQREEVKRDTWGSVKPQTQTITHYFVRIIAY